MMSIDFSTEPRAVDIPTQRHNATRHETSHKMVSVAIFCQKKRIATPDNNNNRKRV